MAAPNIVNVTSILGKTDVKAVTTIVGVITACPTEKVYKINSLVVSNVNATLDCDITVDLYRSGTPWHIAKGITIPANATLVVISKDMGIYLQENDLIRLAASNSGDLEALCSYEVIDDA